MGSDAQNVLPEVAKLRFASSMFREKAGISISYFSMVGVFPTPATAKAGLPGTRARRTARLGMTSHEFTGTSNDNLRAIECSEDGLLRYRPSTGGGLRIQFIKSRGG